MPRQVLHVINSLGYSGGAEQQLLANLAHFEDASLCHTVCRLYNHGGADRVPELPSNTHVFTLFGGNEAQSRLAAVVRLNRLIDQVKPDLVHATLQDSALASRLVTRHRRIPLLESLVNISHDEVRTIDNPAVTKAKLSLHRLIDRYTIRGDQYFHALSAAVEDSWIQAIRIDRNRIKVIPRGIDTDRHRPAHAEEERQWLRRQLQLRPDQRILLNVGRHEPQKGQRYLLDAFDRIASVEDDVVLVIVGREGNSSERLRLRSRGLQHSDRVHFVPEQVDTAPFMRGADLFLFSSLFEGLGVSLLEALASGLPCVVFNRPPMSQIVTESGGGVASPPEEAAALAADTLGLLANPAGCDLMGRAGRQYVVERFTIEEAASATEGLYREILDRASSTSLS